MPAFFATALFLSRAAEVQAGNGPTRMQCCAPAGECANIYGYTMMHFSRRDWIVGAVSSAAWASIAAAQEHAHRSASRPTEARLEFFDEPTAADIAAITSQILPSDDGPGAKEAGVLFFIDRALTTFDAEKQELYRKGITETRQKAREMFPKSADIAGLPAEQQTQLLRAIEKTDFFEAVRVHTVLGFLGDPSYGGNRDKVGWQYIEFEARPSWQPPFGHYDAEAK